MLRRLRSAARLVYCHLLGRPVPLAETFDLLFLALPDPWGFKRSRFEHERFDRLMGVLRDRRYGRALEVGCAEGQFTRRMAEVADSIVALDISQVALERTAAACHDLPVSTARHDLTAAPLPGAGFDLIVASEVLYFIEDPELLRRTAQHIASMLSPGGRLLLSHMRLRRDDTCGVAQTLSGYPRMGAATVHPVFKALPELRVEREDLQPKYAICLLSRVGS
ncbi:MAG: class I SAM-dependent methyltransferase [Candidatus Xenobia bacterium]